MKSLKSPTTFIAHESHISDVKFSLDGQTLLTAGMDNYVKMWSVPDWALTRVLSGHKKSVNNLNLTADGTRVITASSDKTIRIWNLDIGSQIRQIVGVKGSRALLSPDDSCLAVVSNPWLTIVKLDEDDACERIKPFPKRTTALAFSPTQHHLAVGGQGDDILIYNYQEIRQVHGIIGAHEGYVLSLSFSPDGKRLASVGYEKQLCFWDHATWVMLGSVYLENQGVQSLTYSPSGGHLAIASDHRITIIDTRSMMIDQIVDLRPKGVYCLAFSPGGRWLACGAADKRIRVWAFPR